MKENSPVSRDITHTTLSVLFIGALIASSFWILRPFLVSLVWASIIAIATWPVLERLQARLANRRGFAIALMAVVLLLTVLIPIMLAVLTIAEKSEDIATQIKLLTSRTLSPPPDWIERIPLVGEKFADEWREFASLSPEERSARVTPYARPVLEWFVARAGSIGMTALYFLLTVIITIILYAKGETVREGVLNFARRLAGRQGEEVTLLAAKAVRGVVLGVVGTALIQTAVGGFGVFVAGIPAAPLLTAVMGMLCLAQLGPILVLIPAVIWLYWSGQPLHGTVLLVISIIAGTIDNVIRPLLIRKGVDLPILLIFAGVIGGLIAFGVLGLFIGPVVLAVTYTLLKAWVSRSDQQEVVEGTGG